MDDVTNRYGTPRRTLLLEEDGQTVSSVVDSSPQSLEDVEAARGVVRHTAANISVTTASPTNLELTDEPCAVLLSADGRIGRSSTTALDIFAAREASTPRGTNDEITSIFSTTTRSEFGIITSAGRLVKANVSDLPIIHAEIPLTVAAGVQASEFLHSTQSTEPVSGERIVSAVSLDPQTPLGIGTRNGVVKRWNMDSPTTMDSWTVISLNAQDSDEVLFAAPAGDDDRLVFISSDSSLLTFPASQVRPQGRTSSGMAGIKLASDAHVVAFGVVPAGKLAWTADDGNGENKDNPDNMSNMSGTVVLTVAGDSELLPGTQNGAAKLTPLDLFPVKGRATQGVRSQRFLKGENTLLQAYVGQYPIIASSAQGTPVALPDIDMRRDGSGTELSRRIEFVS
jgi:DNA gyrase subunit A